MRNHRRGYPGRSASRAHALPLGDFREDRRELNSEARAREYGRAALARAPNRVDVAVPREAEDCDAGHSRAHARDRGERIQRALLEIDDGERRLARRQLALELLRTLRHAKLEAEPARH